MQTAAKNNLVFTGLYSSKELAGVPPANGQGEFYQHVISSLLKGAYTDQSFTGLGNRLIALAEHADSIRQMETVEQVSQFLLNLPLGKEYKSAGLYFRALCTYRKGLFTEARTLFEHVAGWAPLRYKTRALLSISATFYQDQDYQSFLGLSVEALRAATCRNQVDPQIAIKAQRHISLYKSAEGDHRGALADLEKMFPLIRAVSRWKPYLLYEYLNSYAVELGEVGRLEEAQNVCKIVLASPYVSIYPECRETAKDIEQKARRASRSVVAISRKEIQREDHTGEETSNGQTVITTDEQEGDPGNKLLLFRKRAFKSNKAPLYSHLQARQNQLTLAQKRSRIIDIAYSLAEGALDKLLELANELDDRPAQPRRPREINLEERSNLEMLISLWATGDLNIDDHVAVLSALRDCDDNLRRKNIINLMISYMFRFTQERMEGEHFWRKRVEAQLTPETD